MRILLYHLFSFKLKPERLRANTCAQYRLTSETKPLLYFSAVQIQAQYNKLELVFVSLCDPLNDL